ncbi:hypothetical protein GCM10010297_50390 [Streptomyces malachitofuscus]|nr:hypothetical protein GCM10010297_50390 [Streptomyces malachitofuscus]
MPQLLAVVPPPVPERPGGTPGGTGGRSGTQRRAGDPTHGHPGTGPHIKVQYRAVPRVWHLPNPDPVPSGSVRVSL